MLSNRWRNATRRGPAYRMAVTGGVLALLMVGTLAFLCMAVTGLRDAATIARHSKNALVATERMQRLVVDLGEDARGLILTRDPSFQTAYDADLADLRVQRARLERASARSGVRQAAQARRIVQANDDYLRDYLTPLMSAARRDPASARKTIESRQGLRRLAALRAQRAGVEKAQRESVAASGRHAVDATRGLTIAAAVSGGTMLVLIGLFVAYLMRAIVRPVRQAAAVAGGPEGLALCGPEAAAGRFAMIGWRFRAMMGSLATSRDTLLRVVDEQGALRRVATLVARGVSPAEVFDAVAAEVGHVLAADHTAIIRFEPDDTARAVGYWNDTRVPKVMPPLGGHWPIETGSVTETLRATGRPTRMKHDERATSVIGIWAHAAGINCAVGCPVTVEGRVWGGMIIHWLEEEPPTDVTEARMQEFVSLVGTAIANAQSRSELLASRARVVAAADESRRRIERHLHDGAQQRLVTLALKLRTVEATLVPPDRRRLREELAGLVHGLSGILEDVQEVSRGIVPPVLTRSGLHPALRSLARHSPVPVTLAVEDVGRLPDRVEVAVYYTVAEALKNVEKHACASEAWVDLVLEDRSVRLSVRDDGRGGAALTGGAGLVGLKDRVEALGGTIEIVSPTGAGTSVRIEVPVEPADNDTGR
ncbi:MAG: GAF domain-containing protein [Actinoallomurus sp.]